MNKKGFTLVEILVVIVVLGLIIGIAVPNINKSNRKAKERILLTKIHNIEKAAVLYGQDNRGNFDKTNSTYQNTTHEYCFDSSNNKINDCFYYNTNITVNVNTLVIKDSEGKSYINADDDSGNIINPLYKTENMNQCKIQIYKKYGKIYAVYLKTDEGSSKCFK